LKLGGDAEHYKYYLIANELNFLINYIDKIRLIRGQHKIE
jgi:hypothetical protein